MIWKCGNYIPFSSWIYWTAKVHEEWTKRGFAENRKTRVRQRMRKKKRENIWRCFVFAAISLFCLIELIMQIFWSITTHT